MIIYPAIDLRGGRVVRLKYGDPQQQTTYSDDPLETARHWLAAGATWLHVVNLDGALGEANAALEILRQIAALEGVQVQFGGGLRSLEDAARALEAGAARVILGTAAVQRPELAAEAVRRFGVERVAVALDARGERVATHGWQQLSAWTPAALGRRFAELGVRHALYTDITRDGDLSGVNVAATAALARETDLAVIASGGVASLADVRALRKTGAVAGAIIGRALYSGAVDLAEALRVAAAPDANERS